eukprot:SAG31_NODE_33052_length_348_cov_1.028112_1_plen_48_part_01
MVGMPTAVNLDHFTDRACGAPAARAAARGCRWWMVDGMPAAVEGRRLP